jgi:hypothetical protein
MAKIRYSTEEKLEAAKRLIKAMRNPEADTMKATSDVSMYIAKKELTDAEAYAKEVGLEL